MTEVVVGATNPPPVVVSVDFSKAVIAQDEVRLNETAGWVRDIRQAGGRFDAERKAWVASKDILYGQGRLVIRLNRMELPADVALTLIYEETDGADFVVQLWDDYDRIVALDLFSNIITAGREAQTDTFIIALAQYPSASQIVLRRLKGEVRIYGFVLSPVACEVPADPCDEREMAFQLGAQLSPENPLVREAERIARAQQRNLEWDTQRVQVSVPVSSENEYARKAFLEEGYPEYAPVAERLAGQPFFPVTGSARGFVMDCIRRLNLYHPLALVEEPITLTSYGAEACVMEGLSRTCIMSAPMSTASRERFYRKYGYHLIEVPVALDAIQVMVNSKNPIGEITIPQLDAIYGDELLAGEPHLIRTWGDLGLDGDWADKLIVPWGGGLDTGTGRIFQQRVLQGGRYRSEGFYTVNAPNLFASVTWAVATNRYAIGFANQQHRLADAKVVAVAANSGRPAYRPDPASVYGGHYPLARYLYLYVAMPTPGEMDPVVRELLKLILSREGQASVARMGQIPLLAGQVKEGRRRLGL